MAGAARFDESATPAVLARNFRRDNLPDWVTGRLPELPLA
jgi:hypothetical protein